MDHTIYQPDLPPGLAAGAAWSVLGPEAQHAARVKRTEAGDSVVLTNGRGLIARARIESIDRPRGEWRLVLRIDGVEAAPAVRPRVTVFAPAPKGERLDQMIDGLSQVGAAAWRPLITERTVVEPRAGKLERLQRIAEESLKQCGRAWLLEIGSPIGFAAALRGAHERGDALVVADAAGGAPPPLAAGAPVTLVVGPEGGLTDRESTLAREHGAAAIRLGPHILRIETAAVVGAAALLART